MPKLKTLTTKKYPDEQIVWTSDGYKIRCKFPGIIAEDGTDYSDWRSITVPFRCGRELDNLILLFELVLPSVTKDDFEFGRDYCCFDSDKDCGHAVMFLFPITWLIVPLICCSNGTLSYWATPRGKRDLDLVAFEYAIGEAGGLSHIMESRNLDIKFWEKYCGLEHDERKRMAAMHNMEGTVDDFECEMIDRNPNAGKISNKVGKGLTTTSLALQIAGAIDPSGAINTAQQAVDIAQQTNKAVREANGKGSARAKFCSQCGSALVGSERFCAQCGAKVN
jgi:hypothetical protein